MVNKKEIYVAGFPPYGSFFLRLMDAMRVNVSGIVGNTFSEPPPLPALSLEQYLQGPAKRDIPLVVMDFPLDELLQTSSFFYFLDQILDMTRQPPRIFHAGCYTPRVPGVCEDRLARIGYPGSGNMLAQALIDEIMGAKTNAPEPTPVQFNMSMIGNVHCVALKECINRLLMGMDLKDINAGTHLTYLPGSVHVRALFQNGHFLLINNLPFTGFLAQGLSGHLLWTPSLRRLLTTLGFRRVFFFVRNPFDVIASNAAKTYRPMTRALYDDNWFRFESKRLAIYMRSALEHREAYHETRYEDILKDPVGAMRGMARVLDVDLPESRLREIWEKVGFKPLTAAGAEHLFRPGESKCGYFTADMIRVMESDGHKELAEAYGYDWPDADKAPQTALPHDDDPWKTPSPVYGRPNRFSLERWDHEDTGVICLSDDAATLETVRRRVEAPWFSIFYNALGPMFNEPVPPEIIRYFPG